MGLRRPAPPFKARRGSGGSVAVNLDDGERHFVADLLDEVAAMLDPQSAGTTPSAPSGGSADVWAAFEASLATEPPDDPAVARLLPEGNRDDEALAQGFRRLTEPTLRQRKRSALATAAAALRREQPVVLDAGEAAALLKGLTDLRLVLAERLGLHSDEDAELLHLRLRGQDDGPDLDEAGGDDKAGDDTGGDDTGRDDTGGEAGEPGAARAQWWRLAAVYEALTWWQEALVAAVR